MKRLFFISAFFISEALFAEIVSLKNGTVLKGVIVEMNQTDLVIDTAEMGRVTVKRYTIQKISDDASSGSGASGTVINVNNSNQVEQKNEQTNSQVNNQAAASGKEKDESRRWHQGLQGRFLLSQEGANFKQKGQPLDLPKSYNGIDWDLIGFRSESWWAVYLNVHARSNTQDSVEYSLKGGMIRLDWNAFKNVNGDSISLLYFGIGVGSSTFETETTDLSGLKTSIALSGTRTTLRMGYDYLWSKYWGLSLFASLNATELDHVTYKVDGENVGDASPLEAISINGSSFGVGLLYNIDL